MRRVVWQIGTVDDVEQRKCAANVPRAMHDAATVHVPQTNVSRRVLCKRFTIIGKHVDSIAWNAVLGWVCRHRTVKSGTKVWRCRMQMITQNQKQLVEPRIADAAAVFISWTSWVEFRLYWKRFRDAAAIAVTLSHFDLSDEPCHCVCVLNVIMRSITQNVCLFKFSRFSASTNGRSRRIANSESIWIFQGDCDGTTNLVLECDFIRIHFRLFSMTKLWKRR